ncbi:hypothetical protein UlMin_016808 [Ulmus minor]
MGRSSILILGFVLFLFLSCLVARTEVEYLKYKDPKQPFVCENQRPFESNDSRGKDWPNGLGSALSGGGSVLAPNASAQAQVCLDMVNVIRKASLSTRLGIPMIYGIDVVHGHNNVYNATIFPHNVSLGVTRVLQVCRDLRWGRCYESYSEDYRIVQAMTKIIPSLQGDIPANSHKGVPFVATGKTNVAACAKHFVGDGGTTKGINENNTVINLNGLINIHMPLERPHTQVVFNENPDANFVKSNQFSYAIVVVGEPSYAETFGDSLNLTISEPGPSTIKNVCGAVKCVVVVISGRPIVIQPYLATIDSLVAGWLPGTEGQGSIDQLPMKLGDPHYDPLFPFGFGLTTKPRY